MLGTGVTVQSLPKVSLAVMAHPKRAAFVEELLPALPGATVVWDQHDDRWETGRRSMLAHDVDADWHLVVQDDAILCGEFVPGVTKALAAVGDHPVAFYMGRIRPHAETVVRLAQAAIAARRAWIAARGPWWGVAIALRTHHIEPMLAWCDKATTIPNYDRRIAAYFEKQRIRCWYSVPSLVDHRIAGNPSLVPDRSNSPARTAYQFIGDESPLAIDWTRTPDTPADQHTWRHRPSGQVRRVVVGSPKERRMLAAGTWEQVEATKCPTCGAVAYEPSLEMSVEASRC